MSNTKNPMINPLAEAMPPQPERRRFVRQVALGAVAISGVALAGCGGGDDGGSLGGSGNPKVAFAHGVASGDPLADRVILWTRVSTESSQEIVLHWEVASDAGFTNIVASGEARTSAARDHTVKIDAMGLSAGRSYWYRFKAYDQLSPVGRTRTLPKAGISQVRLAVLSCSNYPSGFFNVYADAAKRNDLDAVLHLGDYIYEYSREDISAVAPQAAELGRLFEPAHEIVKLDDYRRRYAQYRGDADLQALHAALPMIAVWDDHEFSNDTWRDGAQNHQPAEGDFAARKAAAIQAYHEWMPIRSGANAEQIYRSFDFGGLLALHMLDTRAIARDKQLSYANYVTQAGFDAAGFASAIGNPARQLLGTTQTNWLAKQMAASTAIWQVLGQQVLMGHLELPSPLLFGMMGVGGVSLTRYMEIAAKAQTAPQTLTPEELAVLKAPSIPASLDSWDGYPAARETVLEMARNLDKNLVVLAGDSHNAWASDLLDGQGRQVGVEFATPSVSSPGMEQSITNVKPAALSATLTNLVEPLKYCDTSRRGYVVLTATRDECVAEFTYVDTITSRNYRAITDKRLRVLPGAANRKIVA